MYDTAVGVYAFHNCPAIDIVFPIKITTKDNGSTFHPCLVSVKCWSSMNGPEMQNTLESMKKYVNDYREGSTPSVLGILVVIGCQNPGKPPSTEGFFPSQDTYTTVVVPKHDMFGLNATLIDSVVGTEEAEILQSHSFAHVKDYKYFSLLRSTRKKSNDRLVQSILNDRTTSSVTSMDEAD